MGEPETLRTMPIERWIAAPWSPAVVSTLADLRRRAEEVRRGELARVAPRLGNLSADERAAVEAATEAMVTMLLHDPIGLVVAALLGADGAHVRLGRANVNLPPGQRVSSEQ